jgi:hypothetical protein
MLEARRPDSREEKNGGRHGMQAVTREENKTIWV